LGTLTASRREQVYQPEGQLVVVVEGAGAHRPDTRVVRRRRLGIVFAVVKHDFEHPPSAIDLRSSENARTLSCDWIK
jgi:hypothetical protein